MVIVHYLYHGRALCGFNESTPNLWLKDHYWVGYGNKDDVNCEQCKIALKNRKNK